MQVHTDNEQELIELMQKFHWSLLSSQEIKVKDSHLEENWTGDKIMSVTETEHYIKLVFSRDLDLPNLKEIKEIENKYFSLPLPEYPKLFPISILFGLSELYFMVLVLSVGSPISLLDISPKRK